MNKIITTIIAFIAGIFSVVVGSFFYSKRKKLPTQPDIKVIAPDIEGDNLEKFEEKLDNKIKEKDKTEEEVLSDFFNNEIND